ncbi:MAG: SLC13/DASS family transporter [Planctomycetaceae bacterium]|nr:SLC13/DASS family transporter [Planctomycetaceae bacterium]
MRETHLDSPSRRFRWGVFALSMLLLVLFCSLRPFDDLNPSAQRLAGVVTVMAILWSTQALPLEVTSLLPLVLFPFLAIENANKVSQAYMNSTILLYLSGFGIAIGVEKWGLHRRLALTCLRMTGIGPKRIVWGFMLGTALMSMWISNTASTLLMLPIAMAVLEALHVESEDESRRESLTHHFCAALLLGIAYSASVGGMCTLIGTPTNGVYAGYWTASQAPPEIIQKYEISVGQWMVMFVPLSAMMLVMIWLIMCVPIWKGLSFGADAGRHLRQEYQALGRFGGAEWRMMIVFAITALLWTTRASLQIGSFHLIGWQDLLDTLMERIGWDLRYAGLLHDSTAGLLMMSLMFLIPAEKGEQGQQLYLMDWETIQRKTPWGILLLFGGGFAIADACTATGLAAWIGERLAMSMESFGQVGQILSVTTLVIFLTEFTSNTATIATLLPILEKTSRALLLDPRTLMLPATIAASCAFMLPIATPPNAIVFSSQKLRVLDMMKYGLILNLAGILLVTLMTVTWVLKIGNVS